MLETKQILNAIEVLSKLGKVTGKNNDIGLKIKNSKTGEILGVEYNYVADEILFIFASKNGTGTCSNYLRQLEGESQDDCWIDYALYNLNELSDSDENLTKEDIDEDELYKAKYDVVTGLPTRVYVGDLNECPVQHYHKTFEIKDVEVIDNNLVLVY